MEVIILAWIKSLCLVDGVELRICDKGIDTNKIMWEIIV